MPEDGRLKLHKALHRLSAVKSTFVDSAKPGLWTTSTAALEAGTSETVFPAFDDLPKVPGQPQGCMWGFWDRDGKKDEVGSINILTPSVVKAASLEIRTGEHVQLDWSLDNVEFPGFGRPPFQHKVIEIVPGVAALDDEVAFNTQSGSQWDSLKHYGDMKSMKFYNGLHREEATKVTTNGIHNWCERGGIVGRGVLVDWLRWFENTKGAPPAGNERYEITVAEIEEVLRYQGTTTRPGDILLVRSGFVRWHNNASTKERKATQGRLRAPGLQSSETTVRWLYSRHFAAVAGDTIGFEAWPPPRDTEWSLHGWLLPQWGTPIGELWNLEGLSEKCAKLQKWTFFFTSAPLNVKGGVASPPNAVAIL